MGRRHSASSGPCRQQVHSRAEARTGLRNHGGAGIDFRALLERAGFIIRRNRADCPYCQGHSRLTVSIGEDVAHCFRCHWTRNLRTLSRELALPVAAESIEQRKARWRERAFKQWLGICWAILSARLRWLARRAEWAKVALQYDRDEQIAWTALADFYDNEPVLMAALDLLSFEKAGRWLEQPVTQPELFAAFQEALANE